MTREYREYRDQNARQQADYYALNECIYKAVAGGVFSALMRYHKEVEREKAEAYEKIVSRQGGVK